MLANGFGLAIPRLVAQAIDSFGSGVFDKNALIVKFSIVCGLIFVFSYLQGIFQVYVSELAARDLRARLIKKISESSFNYVSQIGSARILTNLTSDVDAVKQFISFGVTNMISSVFLIIGASVLLLMTDWKLGLVVLLIVPLIGAMFFSIFSRIGPLFKKTQEIIDRLNRVINESILGSTLIRVLSSRVYEEQKFESVNIDARNNSYKILSYFSVLIPGIGFISGLAVIAILALGGQFIIQGNLSVGSLIAFNSYVGILVFPIIILGFTSNIMARSGASYSRILEILVDTTKEEEGKVKGKLKGDIELKKVSLKYGEKYALKDVSFKIKSGSRVAIIGPTAAGKTQLMYLLCGLIVPTTGSVLLDGKNLADFEKNNLYEQLAMVFQDSIIFNMSLRENIAFSQKVGNLELEKAIKTAELTEFIKTLPAGLDTIVSERGSSLSGGQKQRVMLARALTLNPKVLLLDDFTARVDTQTEFEILENLRKEYKGITLVSVTQKISSVVDYEQIILLMEGEVIASGNHTTLLQTCPEYVQLFESQKSTNNYELQT